MEFPRDARSPAPRGLLIVSGALIVLTVIAILAIDQPVARAVSGYEPWWIWGWGIHALEVVTLIVVYPMMPAFVLVGGMIATVLVPRWRVKAPAWIFAATTHVVTSLLMGLLKELTMRIRPRAWLGSTASDTFWRDGNSFPSGHVTTFGALAVIVAVLYPRLRVPMIVIIAFVCIARVCMNAHWVSDVTSGVALVTLVAYLAGLAIRPRSPR